MLKLQYSNDINHHEVKISRPQNNIIEIYGKCPVKTCGFDLYNEDNVLLGQYPQFTTVYKKSIDSITFSNDGSIYIPPEPIPEPEPQEPTLEEEKVLKIVEMNQFQQNVIQSGINVTLSDGTTEHFTLTDHDQASLTGLQTQVAIGTQKIPWHTSDVSVHCKYYSNEDMGLIVMQAMQFVTYHVTYFRDLRIYINQMTDKSTVTGVIYGAAIPPEYQSEVLADMYALIGGDNV